MNFLRKLIAGLFPTAAAKAAESSEIENPVETMLAMRTEWLTRVPEKAESQRDDEVVAVLMEWPLGEHTGTVLASSGGDASLHTTSPFGIIGGIAHESVRMAASHFILCAEQFMHLTNPTTEFPYPDGKTVHFYMITPSGVRTVSFPLDEVEVEQSPARALFIYGQEVLTQLRLTSPDQK